MIQKQILVTGGSGLLGSELKNTIPEAQYPSIEELNINNQHEIESYLNIHKVTQIVHAAAFMPPPRCDSDPDEAIKTNIIGTGYLALESIKRNIRLIYISTDYVFPGKRGYYKEEDPFYPVNNYAWSKLGGECTVHMCNNSVIVRTSFGPKIFPYSKAFEDQWTSKEPVNIIASKIKKIIEKEDFVGVIHLGGERKTVYAYAKERENGENVTRIKRKELVGQYILPKDTSLNTTKYKLLFT
jgi:dTDP-4-dehydrorhamnose reductase